MNILFYPTVPALFPYGGVTERHSEGMLVRSLRERAPIVCLLDHDPAQRVASTEDGSLRLVPERDGLRAELDVAGPYTVRPAAARLIAALKAGTVTGASFGFTPRRVRWSLAPRPVRELLDADVTEVSLVLAPKRAANGATWAAMLGPNLRKRYEALRGRPGAAFRPPPVSPPDVVLRLMPLEITPLVKILLGDRPVISRELAAVRAAVAANPTARVVDITYPRPLRDLLAASARHAARMFPTSGNRPGGTASGVVKPVALPGRPANGPAESWGHGHPCIFSVPPLRKESAMPKDILSLHPAHASRREILGPRSCGGFETLVRLDKFKAELERRMPGASRWIDCYRPFIDRRGVWHANPQLRATRAPLTVQDALEKMEGYR